MLTINVYNIHCKIEDPDRTITKNKQINMIDMLDRELSYYEQGYQFTKAYKTGWYNRKKKKWERWDGKRHLLDKEMRFHTGLLHRVELFFKKYKIDYNIVDHRKEVKFKRKIKTGKIQSRPYQDKVVKACLENKGGIVKSATGSGKSVMITRLIAETNVKTIVYVIGVDLLYQMKETFEKFLGTDVGIIGDGQVDIKKINVCSVWTASSALGEKYESFDDEDKVKKEKFDDKNKEKIVKAIRSAEMTIFDECQFLAAKTLQTINHASESAYYKYGFSGTPFRDDNADLLLEAACGPQIVEVTATELIEKEYLVKPMIRFVNVPEYDEVLPPKYPSIYKTYIVENEVRNNKIVKSAEKLIESGRKVLILVKNIKHGNILLEMLQDKYETYFVKGDLDSDERNWVRQEFLKNNIDIIIASVVYDQGVDLPNLDALILAGSGKSSGRTLQRIGRVIRPSKGKKDAIVVDFIDNAKYLFDHSAARAEIYKIEPGFDLKLPKEDLFDDTNYQPKIKKKKKKGKQLQKKNTGGEVPW